MRRLVVGSFAGIRPHAPLILLAVLVGSSVLGLPSPSAAQQITRLPAEVVAGDQFGYSVAIDGEHILIGSPYADDYGPESGGVSVFTREDTGWRIGDRLVVGSVVEADQFGHDVALDSSHAIVGTGAGAAYIFQWMDSTWTEQAQLTVEDGAQSDRFGYTLDISGNYAIVGAHGRTVADTLDTAGTAYIFVRNSNGWVQDTMLTAPEPAPGDHFGHAVAIDGEYAIVGAWGHDTPDIDAGAAYIFERSGRSWNQAVKLTAAEGAAEDEFGFSVAISGGRAFVGAWRADTAAPNAGAAYSFLRTSSGWTEERKWTPDDTTASDAGFGYSVAIDADMAVIGSIRSDGWDTKSGAAHLYTYENDTWSEFQKLAPDSVESDALFGYSVAVDAQGDVLVGAIGDDRAGENAGGAWLYGSNIETPVARQKSELPQDIKLAQNYPNPFNPTTTISYKIPSTGHVKLEIYDVRGRLVATPVNRVQSPGHYTVQWQGQNHPSGVYFYRLTTEERTRSRSMILLK